MLDDSSLRMLAALGVSTALGTLVRRRARIRLQLWERDPEAAAAIAKRAITRSSTALSYVASAVLCVGVVLLVEVVVALVHNFS